MQHATVTYCQHTIPPGLPDYSERLASEKIQTCLNTPWSGKVGASQQGDVQAASSRGGWETPYILPTSKAVFAHQIAAFPVFAGNTVVYSN